MTDYTKADIYEIFHITDEILEGHYQNLLQGKSVVLFFPESSIRTRVTFEKGIALLGGQPILFPSSALDKKEDLQDVIGYLNNWANLLVVRHRDMAALEKIAASAFVPVINALTDANHPAKWLQICMRSQKYGMILPWTTFCSAVSQEISGGLEGSLRSDGLFAGAVLYSGI